MQQLGLAKVIFLGFSWCS